MEKSNLSNSLVCSFIALLITIVFVLSRVGFDPSMSLQASTFLGLLFFLLLSPHVVSRFDTNCFLFQKESFLILVSLIILPLIAFFIPASKYFLWIASPLGYLMWLLNIRATINLFKNAYLFAFCTFVGLWTAFYLFVSEYSTSLYIECLSLGGIAGSGEIDTLFHSSLANIINNYHTISTGLDGLIYTPYHIASHFIYGQLASILSFDGLSFYLVGFAVLGVPLFIKALLTFITILNNQWLKPINLLLLASGLTGMMHSTFSDWMGIWSNQLNSQSYCLALTFFFLLSSLILDSFKSKVHESKDVAQRIILILTISIATAVLIWIKVSVGILFCVLAAFIFLRVKAYKNKFWCILFGLILISSVGAFFSNLFKSPIEFVPFAFYKLQIKPNGILFHFLFFYLWLWMLLLFFFCSQKIKSYSHFINLLKNAKFLSLETAIIFAITASLPGCFVELPGGSEVYFSNVQYWFSLSILIGLNVPVLLSNTRIFKAVVVVLIILAGQNFVASGVKLFVHQYSVRKKLSERIQSISTASNLLKTISERTSNQTLKFTVRVFRVTFLLGHAQSGLESMNSYQILKSLRSLAQVSNAKTKDTLLFIPQTAKEYWYMLDNRLNAPITSTFIAPAFSGLAMIDGLPPIEAKSNIYLFNNYQLRDKEQSPKDISPEIICRKAAKKGFSYVLYFNEKNKTAKLFYRGTLIK